jgi:uncharacterized membrane protein YjgN (DUF898 family)
MTDRDPADDSAEGATLPGSEPRVVPPPLPSRPIATRPQRIFFTGAGGEYFKIWIVNLLLTVITLGVYSAWAKVRRLEYFYRHTRLAGAGFDYHGSPMAILKGRLIAALLFGGYYAAGLVSPEAGFAAFIVLLLVLPFLIVRALRFRLYNTSYRGLRFRFGGGTGEAYRVFLGIGVATLCTLFMLLPFWVQRQRRYVHANSCYGKTPFTFDAPVAGFYRIYLTAFAAGIALVVALAVMMFALIGSVVIGGSGSDAAGSAATMIATVVLGFGYVLGTVGIWSFVGARVQNLAWNHTRLGPHRFRCELRARRLMAITITNVLAIVFTLGLFKPFADVRLTKYLTSAFTFEPAGSLDEFFAGEQQHIAAVGDEAVDMFDVDLAF